MNNLNSSGYLSCQSIKTILEVSLRVWVNEWMSDKSLKSLSHKTILTEITIMWSF